MENLFDELGIPKKYLKKTIKDDRFIALVHKQWLKSLIKHLKLSEFIERHRYESWPVNDEEIGPLWTRIFVTVYRKKEAKVLPLPRIRPQSNSKDDSLLFSQLMQYISQTNYKNLWKESYKKYVNNDSSSSNNSNLENQILLANYNDVLREILLRIYGCCYVNVCNTQLNLNVQFDVHLNILPALCAVETLNAIFLLHLPYIEHNLNDCITFSPAILNKCYTKPLFIVYQLLQILKSLHDRSLTLGNISLNDVYLTEDMWIYILPQVNSNIYIQEPLFRESNPKLVTAHYDCHKLGHRFINFKCENCGIKTYDRIQIAPQDSLENLCQYWIDGKISNFTYISILNKLSGRKLGDPNCHHVFPWVTDFSQRCGKNWRDLKKSKYRLNKGDRQLDLTFENNSQLQVPHHVSDVLSAITYYVYMARRTPKSVLCKHVRTVWVPAEYPSSIQRLQEWTPDECIPEFFTDPAVFRSNHEDLDDLEVPAWASGPEDFVEKHREALESAHVSERLHYWIDLTFGYKLAGNAAIKAKNVCLHLADDHKNLTKSGIVQLFSYPHPARNGASQFWTKTPPKIVICKTVKPKRDRSTSSMTTSSSLKSDDEDDPQILNRSPLALSKILSRSRSSLNEESSGQKLSRSPSNSNQRSASLGPKNPTFQSHITQKSKSNQLSVPTSTLNTGIIYLPKEYKPDIALELLEKKHAFLSKTFHRDLTQEACELHEEPVEKESNEDFIVQNAFTNLIFSENFEERMRCNRAATKSHTFPIDNHNYLLANNYNFRANQKNIEQEQIVCNNFSEIISTRRIRELQILGCLIVEIFMSKQLRALGAANSSTNQNFNARMKACLTILRCCKHEIPACISYVVDLLLQPNAKFDGNNFAYPSVTDLGLPPPSAHLLLEPLLHCIIPFSKHFYNLYELISALKELKNVALELNILYHFDCNGEMCAEYEHLERTKILLAQNIGECKVKACAKHLDNLIEQLNPNTDMEIINILLPHIRELIEDPPTSVLAAWYLFDQLAKILGPVKTSHELLDSILKLYENEPSEIVLPYNAKIAKLYHHSFLLRLMVRLGLRCFLENFVAPLVEAVGGYKDYEKVDFILHTHSEKVMKKMSHLKTMDNENVPEMSNSDDSSASSEKASAELKYSEKATEEEELFEFDQEDEGDETQMKSLIEQLELNVSSDLPFNHSTAEEALDATLTENIEQLRNLEELNLDLTEAAALISTEKIASPTIPIPSSYQRKELIIGNISCEIGSKQSDSSEFNFDSPTGDSRMSSSSTSNTQPKVTPKIKITAKKLQQQQDVKISEMSADSLVWLSHRLGPVLTARYLSRNLLKMLTLCYVGKENLVFVKEDAGEDCDVSVAGSRVLGDQNAAKVLDCLASIAGLYGEQLILFQYIPHMSELIALCKRKLTGNLEGGLISCLTLLKHIIPYLSDSALMDQLQDVILKNVLHPTVRLLGSTKYTFPSGSQARTVLARKYIDALYILSIRMGSDMTKSLLAVPALQRFFLIFDKVDKKEEGIPEPTGQSGFNLIKDPIESADSLSPPRPLLVNEETIANLALEELRQTFTPELAYIAYLPFLKHVGEASLEISLKNHESIRELCQQQITGLTIPKAKLDFASSNIQAITPSSSIGSNIAVIGNRLDMQTNQISNTDLLSIVSNRIENNSRHLHGNWLAYWEHEIGRSEKDTMFNFKQIKLQSFSGHANSVKSLHVLDNENSFMSGSRDKTVKLWSLRSQGDGSVATNCQWTYAAHKKSILSIGFVESMRFVVSCDSIVHIWDPFMGANVAHLDAVRYAPVNVLRPMPAPSSLVLAATTDGTIKVIDVRLCNYIHELKINANQSGLIRCLAVSPCGSWVAAGQSSGNITVLDTRTGLVISNWRGHESEVLQIIALDTKTIISSSLDQSISVWNVSDGKFKFYMRGATETVHCLNVYYNELISGTTANRIGVHTSIDMDACFSTTKLRSDAFKGLLTSMAVLPLNRLLLLGSESGNISLLC